MKHFLITYTKVHHELTEEQRDKIMNVDFTEMWIGNSLIKLSNISDILDEQKYYETFPKKRPTETRDDFADRGYSQQIRRPTKRAAELMKKGFIGHQLSIGKTLEEAEIHFKKFRMFKVVDHWQKVVDKYKDRERNASEESHYQFALTKI